MSATMAEDKESLCHLTRLFKLKTLKHATLMLQIRSIHDMTVRVCFDNSLSLVYSFHAADLDSLCQEFKSFDLAVLNCLFELNRLMSAHTLYTLLFATLLTCKKPFGHKYVLWVRSSPLHRVLLIKHVRRSLSQFRVHRRLFAANVFAFRVDVFRKFCYSICRRSKPFHPCLVNTK